jgi:hypothetical protein
MDNLQDSHVKNVIQKYSERSKVGLLKYGTTLERTDLTNLQWLQHLQEELMDATLYIERIMSDIKKVKATYDA